MMITSRSESESIHPLARFVTPEAVALLLKIKIEQIKDIRCWKHVILVVAQGLTRFVSYADLPPIIAAEPPKTPDIARWRRRWNKNETKQAPEFWLEFYKQKFCQAVSIAQLYTWGQLLGIIKCLLSPTALDSLRNEYLKAQKKLQHS
jgi:hypothetical protein